MRQDPTLIDTELFSTTRSPALRLFHSLQSTDNYVVIPHIISHSPSLTLFLFLERCLPHCPVLTLTFTLSIL